MAASDHANTHESYAFACLRCGFGWEQEFEIEHRSGPDGQPVARYLVDGRQVPSPLTQPSCPNCGGHRVRVLPAGAVTRARRARGGEDPLPG
ncbi:hypothetical protein RM844_18730 [Streptomyces sp. DSM 44915]|uniref:Uncharacterized protein n=1 Tax=Streptomyces chisholmiae TaxID=3075540 RepID=A0ABU2JTK5_9ACTN|nr:hypothetical protein [Streptomyces sp. DSM 44915]MDT0268321.1 hypothetical protein [Streptomyces sp. DSM 44915]